MILPFAVLIAVMTLFATLSPLLTFAHLWQVKEWRFDRLREHLRANGWYGQLLGNIRPPLVAIVIVVSGFNFFGGVGEEWISLLVLASVSLLQIGLGKQPRPVWTMKAKTLVGLSSALITVMVFVLVAMTDIWHPELNEAVSVFILVIPLTAPLFVLLSWVLLRPIDMTLKNRILTRAEKIRRAHPNLRVIGITGSVGKTTVKELLSHILKDQGALTTPERVNTEMGVAGWLTTVLAKEPTDSKRIMIVEMGAYRKGEIALLCRIAQPQFGIITYVGDQHLSLFGSREAIVEGKGELFEALPSTGHAFGNSDNDVFEALKAKTDAPMTAVGTGQHADVQATDIEETAQGLRFKALGTLFNVPVAGTHTVNGILLAIAVANHLGMQPQEIAQKLQSFVRLSKTFEVKTIGATVILDDTYNSSPDSVRAAINWAATQPHRKKIAVIEGIIELGQAEAEIHQKIAEQAGKVFDEIYIGDIHFLPYFQVVLGDRAKAARDRLQSVEDGSLLALIGRVPKHLQKRFLPS